MGSSRSNSSDDDRDSRRKRRRRSSSRDRSRSRRGRDRGRRSKDRSKERDRSDRRGGASKRRSRSRHSEAEARENDRKRSSSRASSRVSMDIDEESKAEKRIAEEKRMRREEQMDRRKRELEDAKRDDMTVLVLNLSLKATERDVWKFFSDNCGKVRDIQVIRDNRSGRSKGVGYVEFFTQESVIKALALSGQEILGSPIKVQSSQAEKNRAARAAKQQAAEVAEGGPMKLYVGGLVGQLKDVSESEIRMLFAPFGEVVSVEIVRDPYTHQNKGFCFVHYRRAADAKTAMAAMNGFQIGNQEIKVGYATDTVNRTALQAGTGGGQQSSSPPPVQQRSRTAEFDGADNERLDEDGGGVISGPSTRLALMEKLKRDSDIMTTKTLHNVLPNTLTTNLALKHMFVATEVIDGGPDFYEDLEDDVRTECDKFGSVVSVVVERESPDGTVLVKFQEQEEAGKAYMALEGRLFSGRAVRADFLSDTAWNHRIKEHQTTN